MNEVVYLAILVDRHVDDDIQVFQSLDKARDQVLEWKEGYGDDYNWREETLPGWLFYTSTDSDDGPYIRIEQKELR